jgi:hypothetical protein
MYTNAPSQGFVVPASVQTYPLTHKKADDDIDTLETRLSDKTWIGETPTSRGTAESSPQARDG